MSGKYNTIYKMSNNEYDLAAELQKWFDNHGKSAHVWSRNKIGKLIKDNLSDLDHWKNKKRGRSKKGGQNSFFNIKDWSQRNKK